MPEREPPVGDEPRPVEKPAAPRPTDLDVDNARVRQEIAERMEREYARCLSLALRALGPGYTPWMKLILLESDYHRHRDRPPVVGATVYKVYRGRRS